MLYIMVFATFIAFTVKGISGFANSLIFSSILTFQTNNVNITPVDLLLNIPANAYLTWQHRKSVSMKLVLPLCALMAAGIIPGALFLQNGDTTLIKILFGFVVTILAIEMFLRERSTVKYQSSRIVLLVIGIVAGICCGLFGIGAVLAAYISRTTENTNAFKGNLCFVFLFDNFFRLGLYTYTGIINAEVLSTALMLLPVMIVALLFGMFLGKYIPEKAVKQLVIVLLFLSGISLVLTNLL